MTRLGISAARPVGRYDRARGQFTQQDPIGIAGGLNLYGYANGDPVNFSDPFGLCPCLVHHPNRWRDKWKNDIRKGPKSRFDRLKNRANREEWAPIIRDTERRLEELNGNE